MAETAFTHAAVNAIGTVGTVVAVQGSSIASNLMQANFEQLITLQFNLQLGDIVALTGVVLLIRGAVRELLKEKRRAKDEKDPSA